MSGWLKSVNNLLETIDNGVGDVVENQVEKLEEFYDEDDEGAGYGGHSSVDDILAKRGLLSHDEDEDDEDDEDEDDEDDDSNKKGDGDGDNNDDEEGDDQGNEESGENNGHGMEVGAQGTTSFDADLFDDDNFAIRSDPIQVNTTVHEEEDNINTNNGTEEITTEKENTGDTSSVSGAEGTLRDGNDNSEGEDEPIEVGSGSHDSNDDKETASPTNEDNLVNDNAANIAEGNTDADPDADADADADADVVDGIQEDTNVESSTSSIPANGKNKEAPVPAPVPVPVAQKSNPMEQKTNNAYLAQIASLKKMFEAQTKLTKEANSEKTSADKETRKLRRTLVKLNSELDSAERELDAQRTELERAAARIEKDRIRAKEEKERLEASQKEDMKTVAEEHKASISAMVDAHSKQIVDMENRIERAEEARAKEGGDMTAELADAIERERDTLKKLHLMEEEKSTFASQVSSLNTQIVGLESRIGSLQQGVDSATEQERDADDRLDAALSLHARQLSQRQAREAELERNIADLGAALVVARSREANLFNKGNDKSNETLNNTISELKDALLHAKDEVEMLDSQVMMERQKAETLEQALDDVSNEQAQEASAALERQKDYDNRVTELSSTIAQLTLKQNSARDMGDNDSDSHSVADKLQKQVGKLSEDLIRQKSKFQHSTTEVKTLKNRLKSALSRAEIAEKAAPAQSSDMEQGLTLPNGNQIRRRYGVQSRKTVTSISSALKLNAGRGETSDSIGKIIDTIDTIAIDTGSRFRSDPISRAIFLLYLTILHLWAFCLVLFHAHGTLEPSPDIGPEQLLQHSYRHIEQSNFP